MLAGQVDFQSDLGMLITRSVVTGLWQIPRANQSPQLFFLDSIIWLQFSCHVKKTITTWMSLDWKFSALAIKTDQRQM